MRRFKRFLVLPAALALALSAAGCGDDPGSADQRRTFADATGPTGTRLPAPPTDDDPSAAPATAYAAWVDALARHDAAAACALQAPEFTIELRYDAILLDRAELGDPCTGFEAILWEDPAFTGELVDVSATQVTQEDALLAVALGPGRDSFQTVRMVYHRAKWRVFSTEKRTGAGTDGGPGSESGPARWLDAWCGLSPDQTRAEIIGRMGEPSGEYTVADGGEPQLWWAQDQYDFRVYLDPVADTVLELVGDYDALGAEDRAVLTCPELRR